MKPDECPHCAGVTQIGVDPVRVVHCKLLSDAVGWSHGVCWAYCERCIAANGPASPEAADHGGLASQAVAVLSGRFKALGVHSYGAFSLSDCLRRYGGLAGTPAQRDLFREALKRWAATPEDEGGLPLDTVEKEAQALAEEFGFEDVLTDITRLP